MDSRDLRVPLIIQMPCREKSQQVELCWRKCTVTSQGMISKDVLMTFQMPGIKEYDISFRSRTINILIVLEGKSGRRKTMNTTRCVEIPLNRSRGDWGESHILRNNCKREFVLLYIG